jgi:hypothetical protein
MLCSVVFCYLLLILLGVYKYNIVISSSKRSSLPLKKKEISSVSNVNYNVSYLNMLFTTRWRSAVSLWLLVTEIKKCLGTGDNGFCVVRYDGEHDHGYIFSLVAVQLLRSCLLA